QVNHNCATMAMLLLYKFYSDVGSFMPGFSFNCSLSGRKIHGHLPFNLCIMSNGISCTIDAISSRCWQDTSKDDREYFLSLGDIGDGILVTSSSKQKHSRGLHNSPL
ncbi:hypothetical protein Y956_08186, partial [Nipponia nippon]